MGAQLKAALKRGDVVKVFLLGQFCHPKLVEMIGWYGGFDAVWFDQEHAGLSIAQIEEAARAARGCGLDSFVRLPATDYAAVMRPLEAGAGGVMASMIRSVQEVEDLLRWTKFHPRGVRGVNGSGVDGRYGGYGGADYYSRANAESFIAVQIETAEALQAVEAIAAVPDVDVLFVGPADLSQALGIPGNWDHPTMWQAVERVAAAAKANGVAWGVLSAEAAHARRCVELGCRVLSIGVDVWTFRKGLKVVHDDFAEFFKA
jgi:2-dehydro-3-deoxyglucarate aldolase/4-hydroxy-2-oxoheptanedioate aldolase